jgi:iron-sulfur cluster repair protein YtfE (RIC family)
MPSIAPTTAVRDLPDSREDGSSEEPATRCLEVDHRDLDATLLAAQDAASSGCFADAHWLFTRFAAGLTRHIGAEESVLFPELEALDERAKGPILVMHADHRELRELMDRIEGELAAARSGWKSSTLRLKQLLLTHNTREERVLYPMSDAAARRAGRARALAERLRGALARV